MNSYTLETEIQPLRRVKERQVQDALDKVELWKKIISEGFVQPDGTIHKVTLNKAAGIIGIPKKTLEDYNQLFRKVELITDVQLFKGERMGVLREFLRKNSKKIKKLLKEQQLIEKSSNSPQVSTKKNSNASEKNTQRPEQSIEQEQTGLCGYRLKKQTCYQNSETPKNYYIDNQFEIKEEDFDDFDYESYQSPLGLPPLNQTNKYDLL